MDYRAPVPPAPLLVVATTVTALDRATGQQLWSYDLGSPARRFAVEGDRMFVFNGDGLHCLDVRSGALIGKVHLEMKSANTMLVDGDRVYVSDDFSVVALDLNGQVLWRASVPPNGSFSLTGLAVVGGNIVQPDFSRSG